MGFTHVAALVFCQVLFVGWRGGAGGNGVGGGVLLLGVGNWVLEDVDLGFVGVLLGLLV